MGVPEGLPSAHHEPLLRVTAPLAQPSWRVLPSGDLDPPRIPGWARRSDGYGVSASLLTPRHDPTFSGVRDRPVEELCGVVR
ncbi:MAG: hypothetical protein M3N52_01120 [Actinomycetota bacterium]|nr:hypothetical protein [Actinomycetota bacterium]